MNDWKAESHGDKPPSEWNLYLDGSHRTEVSVHKYIGCGDAWFLSCHMLNIKQYDLDTDDINKAKEKALIYLSRYVMGWSKLLMEAVEKE